MAISIYLILDENAVPRYVGKTVQVQHRFAEHKKACEWAFQCLVIEVVAVGDRWQDREKFWIAYYSQWFSLENKTPGGNGSGQRSAAAIAKHKASMQARGVEGEQQRRDKIRQALAGKKRPADVVKRIAAGKTGKGSSLKGIPRPESHKRAMQVPHPRAVGSKKSLATKLRMAEGQRASWARSRQS